MMGMIIIHIKLNHHFFLPILVESASFLVGNDVWSFSLGGLDAAAAAHPRISTWWCPIWSTWWRLGSSHWTNWEAEFDTIPHEKPIRKKICCHVGLCLWKTSYVYNMTGVRQGYLSRVVQACDMFLQDHSISAKHSAWIITFSTVPNIILGTKHQLISSFAVPAWIVTSLAVISWLAWHWEERQTIRRSVFTFNHFQL